MKARPLKLRWAEEMQGAAAMQAISSTENTFEAQCCLWLRIQITISIFLMSQCAMKVVVGIEVFCQESHERALQVVAGL